MSQADDIVAAAALRKQKRERAGAVVPSPPAARTHGKRHGENRERSRIARAKSALVSAANEKRKLRHQHTKAVMRAYYAGALADLSALE